MQCADYGLYQAVLFRCQIDIRHKRDLTAVKNECEVYSRARAEVYGSPRVHPLIHTGNLGSPLGCAKDCLALPHVCVEVVNNESTHGP